MSLRQVVELFRLAGKPTVSGGRFSASVQFNQAIELITGIRAKHENWFDEIVVDGIDVHEGDSIPPTGSNISFEIHLPSSSAATFHQSISTLISKVPQTSRGEVPDEFYLIDEDYYTYDSTVPVSVQTLRTLCELITGLKGLAFHDKQTPQGHLSLVFVQPSSDNYGKPVVIETFIDNALLASAKGLDPTLVTNLATIEPGDDPHYSARLGVFGVTLSGFVNRREPNTQTFAYLIHHWKEFTEAYQNDLGTYLSGFAFHKAKKEVASAEFDIASQYSKILSDISGKLLSIPLSFAAIAAIPKADGMLQSALIVLGILLAAFIVSGIIDNQNMQFKRVRHAKNLVLSAIEGKKSDYPTDLTSAVDDMTRELNKNERSLGRLLVTFRVFSWIPALIALLVHAYIYSDTTKNLVLRIIG